MMTANPSWSEITRELYPGQTSSDHPDLITHVFCAKLQTLIADLKNGILGDLAAFIYTIEFQKRSLPHAHLIAYLKPHAKACTSDDIDSLLSSELPEDDPDLFALVKKFYGPWSMWSQQPQLSIHG